MEDACVREVKDLHVFFEQWYGGKLPDTDEGFGRMTSAIADDFHAIGPRGNHSGKSEITRMVGSGHGSRRDSDFRIEIRNAVPRQLGEDVCAVTYEEWQLFGGEWTARSSSAAFRRQGSAPNGAEWVLLHESWLPGYAGAQAR